MYKVVMDLKGRKNIVKFIIVKKSRELGFFIIKD